MIYALACRLSKTFLVPLRLLASVMALCFLSAEEREGRARSRAIDRNLRREKQLVQNSIKILLLGAGESGKSTVLKQMRILHGGGYTVSDKQDFRSVVYHNILKGMKILIEARRRMGLEWENYENERNAQRVSGYRAIDMEPEQFLHYVTPLISLWEDDAIQATFSRRREFQIGDSVQYFCDRLSEAGTLDYLPSNDDIVHARKATRGIVEYNVTVKEQNFRIVDVGGQRSQRQKWFQCFDNVDAILYLVASSAFDQNLLEDRVTNRLVESVNIFETIVNNRCFKSVSIILFLNKTDLLEEKVKTTLITDYFPNFEDDPHDLNAVQVFIVSLFDSVRYSRERDLFYHRTTATSTEQMKFIVKVVADMLIQEHLKSMSFA